MNIQSYTKMMAMIAKVEEKREQYDYFDAQLRQMDDQYLTKPYEWGLAYEAERKAAKAVRKAYKDYRKMVTTDEEINHIGQSYSHRIMCNRDFYLRTRWAIIEEARHIQFEVNHEYFC